MRRLGLALIFCASVMAPLASGQELGELRRLEHRARSLAREAAPKTVCVIGVIGSGSGAVVSPGGRIVTNAHVAAAARYAVMLFSDGSKRLAKRRASIMPGT